MWACVPAMDGATARGPCCGGVVTRDAEVYRYRDITIRSLINLFMNLASTQLTIFILFSIPGENNYIHNLMVHRENTAYQALRHAVLTEPLRKCAL